MDETKEIVSGGSGTSHGEPVKIDYRKLLEQERDKAAATLAAIGDTATSAEIGDMLGLSHSHMRTRMHKLRTSDKVRAVPCKDRGWLYSLEDVYKVIKERNA